MQAKGRDHKLSGMNLCVLPKHCGQVGFYEGSDVHLEVSKCHCYSDEIGAEVQGVS